MSVIYAFEGIIICLALAALYSLTLRARLYATPVIMWSNVSTEKLHFSGESIYYLPQMLIDYAGLPDSNMTRILRYERSCFKTNDVWKPTAASK